MWHILSIPSLSNKHLIDEIREVRRVRSEFIQRVSYPVIKGLLDDLWQQKVFSTEDKDSVMVEQRFRADQARRLIDMVIGKGERASQIMIYCMKMRDKHLYSTLGLIPSPAGDIKAEVELKRLFSRGRCFT
uniref:CARD domain-containing protein n=1 Tax=Gadus morhua TaxID=8049 RepID=A0A8C5APH3_GADMO